MLSNHPFVCTYQECIIFPININFTITKRCVALTGGVMKKGLPATPSVPLTWPAKLVLECTLIESIIYVYQINAVVIASLFLALLL
jgi:hypothetical protein